jgi:hypothetical protein
MDWSAVALVLVFLLLDAQNLASRVRRPLQFNGDAPDDDFTVVVPLWGHPRYFRNARSLEPYRANVLLAVNLCNDAMAGFADEAEADGWRVHRVTIAGRVSVPRLVLAALEAVTTAYVIRMDGDTRPAQHPGEAVAAIRQGQADLASVKVRASRRRTAMEKLQAVEYDMAMLGRHLRPWMTSGACMIGRTAALRQILSRHSNWFPGEDIETGVIANHFRMRVRHVDFAVYTDVPETFRHWLNQRRMWWSGSFRMAFVNVDQTIRYPVTFFYTSGLVWLLCLAKWGELQNPAHIVYTLPFILLIYTGLCAASSWQVRSRWMIAFPYYSLFQVLVLPPLGLLYYLKLWWQTRSLAPPGRYRIGFRTRAWSLPAPDPVPARALAALAVPVERRNLATRPWATSGPTAQPRRAHLASVATGTVFEPSRATLHPRSGPVRLRPAPRP